MKENSDNKESIYLWVVAYVVHDINTELLVNFTDMALTMKVSDIFLQEDADKLLHNKFIVIIGDSSE